MTTNKTFFRFEGSEFDTQTASETPSALDILNSKEQPTGVIIKVIGSESQPVREFQDKYLKKSQAAKFKEQKTGKPEILGVDQIENIEIESAMVRTVGWSGVSLDGETEAVFNAENARLLFSKYRALREQVIRASEDLGIFTKT